MAIDSNNLNNRLLYLPVSILGRVELWLTYRGLKKASSVSLRNKFDVNTSSSKRLVKWLTDAALSYEIDECNKELLHVAQTVELAHKMAMIQWSENKKDIVFRGAQYGFPDKAASAFSKNHKSVVSFTSQKDLDFPWKPYVRYMVRIGHQKEDSLVAKKWAETIRQDVPTLAIWYEKKMSKLK